MCKIFPKTELIRGRAICEKAFLERLYSDPSSVAVEYKIDVSQVNQVIADIPRNKMEQYAASAQQILDESTELQKAL
ncbi:MAG: hypothetical protein NT120_01905 [Candidatus Aenigmarchaeota archaeon]|nr:hypothetical protein [Candidatus Aenigmarchaeota archaeon]